MAEERIEEEELAASLFGTKKSRREADIEDAATEEDQDEYRDQGPSSRRINAEQHLDDDQVRLEN